MTPPKIYVSKLPITGKWYDIWHDVRFTNDDVAYFSEEHVRVTVFAYLQGLNEFVQSTYGINISAGTITENIMGKLKGDNNE